MKKGISLLLIVLLAWSFVSCAKKEPSAPSSDPEPYIVKTYEKTPEDQIEEYFDSSKIVITATHYEMSDGTWQTEDHAYEYKLELTGRLHNAAKDSTYVILSNSKDITFDQAWKASGLSSNLDDYFQPEDAVIVGIG